MNWEPTEMMTAIGGLARQILKDDPAGWDALVESQLLEVDDVLDMAALIEQVGRAGAQVPVFETLCLGWPIRAHGEAPAGAVLTAGLHEEGSRDPRHATTEVRGGLAYGTKVAVPAVTKASWVAIPAADGVSALSFAGDSQTGAVQGGRTGRRRVG